MATVHIHTRVGIKGYRRQTQTDFVTLLAFASVTVTGGYEAGSFRERGRRPRVSTAAEDVRVREQAPRVGD